MLIHFNNIPARHPMSTPQRPNNEEQRFRRRLAVLAIVALAGIALLVARVVWLQAIRGAQGML
jgi:ferric-dicitrate binding protein FerR (iron transport regulator)